MSGENIRKHVKSATLQYVDADGNPMSIVFTSDDDLRLDFEVGYQPSSVIESRMVPFLVSVRITSNGFTFVREGGNDIH